jgi:hypothetical protein
MRALSERKRHAAPNQRLAPISGDRRASLKDHVRRHVWQNPIHPAQRDVMRYVLIVALTVLSHLDPSAAQAGRAEDRESLRRLPGVEVIVENFLTEEEAAGFSRDGIRTGVELVLQSNGIRILSASERLQTSSAPFLYVKVNPLKDSSAGTYCLAIEVELHQTVSLLNRPEQKLSAHTWNRVQVAIIGEQITGRVIEVVEPLIKQFANDFLTVN